MFISEAGDCWFSAVIYEYLRRTAGLADVAFLSVVTPPELISLFLPTAEAIQRPEEFNS
jgi:hypothetical protein